MEVSKIKRANWKKISYKTNQYSEGELALVKDINYSLVEDTVHGRYFVMNLNNQIIYLDRFIEDAIVELDNKNQVSVNFSELKLEIEDKERQNRSRFFYIDNFKK